MAERELTKIKLKFQEVREATPLDKTKFALEVDDILEMLTISLKRYIDSHDFAFRIPFGQVERGTAETSPVEFVAKALTSGEKIGTYKLLEDLSYEYFKTNFEGILLRKTVHGQNYFAESAYALIGKDAVVLDRK